MAFEYRTTYLPMRYQVEKAGMFFKQEMPTTTPDRSSIEEWAEHMDALGLDGWELVSTQQVLRGIYDVPQAAHAGGGAISYPLTDGVCLFWKRPKAVPN